MSLKVLLVDDEPIVREVLGAQLRALGHVVALAASGSAAAAAAANDRFDVVVVDQRLDGEDGRTLLQRLRDVDGTRTARAIAISAELDAARAAELKAVGFAATLEKPVDITQLNAALSAAELASSLDDAAALAIWGRMDTVRTLRGMLRDELPMYRDLIEAALARRDENALRDVLHRMKSSAGFCGAIPLTRFIDTTPRCDVDWTQLLPRYDAACAELMPDLQAALAT
ncbi:MAG TPA: response regulator [Pseudomonadota bacterium]|jgi:CheY-like chemotaxis protein|nr:response regulator [Pseudomonadota bacterium]